MTLGKNLYSLLWPPFLLPASWDVNTMSGARAAILDLKGGYHVQGWQSIVTKVTCGPDGPVATPPSPLCLSETVINFHLVLATVVLGVRLV